MSDELKAEAQRILDHLAFMPFEDCIPLTKEFQAIPPISGLYAVRHQELGILYIGKARTLRDRFRGGHKALLWAFIEEMRVGDVRITFYPLDFIRWIQLSSELEALLLQASEPPYNVRIPLRD
jgi:excinuclease UvrABC nuclease subunit